MLILIVVDGSIRGQRYQSVQAAAGADTTDDPSREGDREQGAPGEV